MRYLGIDYGEKRMGIAISDAGGRIAFPKTIFNRQNPRIKEQFKALLEKERIAKIVIGLPLNLDGSESEESKKVRAFVEELKEMTTLPIEFENEMLTTHLVEQYGIKKEHTDAAAAAVILQSYLDKISKF